MCPDLAIRSTFIVGFPGETDEDFEMMLEWLREAEIDRAGCFKYEAVDGASANQIDGAVAEEVKEERWHRFMQTQQEISTARLKRHVGKELDVLVDNIDGETAQGRTKYDAPEIDGIVHISNGSKLRTGQIIKAKITASDNYDLFASVS